MRKIDIFDFQVKYEGWYLFCTFLLILMKQQCANTIAYLLIVHEKQNWFSTQRVLSSKLAQSFFEIHWRSFIFLGRYE